MGLTTQPGTSPAAQSRPATGAPALVVDVDRALVRTDLLVESIFAYLGRRPLAAPRLLVGLLTDRAALKQRLAQAVEIDPATLPYEPMVLARIAAVRRDGGEVFLVTGLNLRLAQAIADHVGADGVFASDERTDLTGPAKARRLVEAFGEGGFDYVGHGVADGPVWAAARDRMVIDGRPSLIRRLAAQPGELACVKGPDRRSRLRAWLRLLRPHQWSKNLLAAVPLLTAHAFTLPALAQTALAVTAFSLCASSVYVINDLVDIQADRGHPTKKNRPFAAGDLPVLAGALGAPLLLALAVAVAALVSVPFLAVLGGYWLLTSAYTFILKRKMMIDVVALAALYTLRVVGGAAAIAVPVSEWMLAFAMFIFLSLALIKRHSEMAVRLDAGLPDPTNRNYRVTDLPVLIALSAAAGYSAIIVFCLYLSSPAVYALYRHPKALWLELPLLLYWISRAITLSHRREMNDDPIVFALKDRVSLATAVLVGLVGVLAL